MKIIRRTSSLLLLLFILSIAFSSVKPVSAAAVTGFSAGRIMDDAIFTKKSSMSAAQIQTFLNSKVPTCDTNGTKTSEYGGGTRAQYGKSQGYPPPYVCLKSYKENPTVTGNTALNWWKNGRTNLQGSTVKASGAKSAAQIIYDASQEFSINPQVLIVLLQKEQGLVTDTWPWPDQYRSATGYGCPDTAACASQYYGFYNQVRWSARMFRAILNQSPTWYTPYDLGNNKIYWHPDTTRCGSSTVNIQNLTTVALYSYTPYRPNQAALNAGYGTGNSCSSYGNRNFYQYFKDWFGSPLVGSDLLRSSDSATVYLVSGDSKYPIGDVETVSALYPLGSVKFVSSSYLSSLTTKTTVKRLVKGSSSTLYFFDAGIKLPFSSCAMIANYGMGCSDYTQLTDAQIDKLSSGPTMPQAIKTTSGKLFYMDSGEKKETTSTLALSSSGLPSSTVRLNESSLASLPLGLPIVKNNSALKDRTSDDPYLYSGGSTYKLPSSLKNLKFLSTMYDGSLDPQSITKLSGSTINGYLTDGITRYLLGESGKYTVANYDDFSSSFTTLPTALLSAIPNSGFTLNNADFFKSNLGSSIYRVSNLQKSPIASWGDLVLIDKTPRINTIPSYYLDNLSNAKLQFGPSRLIKSDSNATVYMIDGLDHKRILKSFNTINSLGISSRVTTTTQNTIDSYATSAGRVDTRIKCGSTYYLGTMGKIHSLSQTIRQQYGFADGTFVTYDDTTCNNIAKGPGFNASYIKPVNGRSVYYVENGTKRSFGSYESYATHNSTNISIVALENSLVDSIPDGTQIN